MTLKQIHELNERFQKSAVQLSELIPSGGLTNATSMIIRCMRKVDAAFVKLLKTSSEVEFTKIMSMLESEIDEVIFILDQLEIANKKRQISILNDFLQEGYSLLSIYSKSFDSIIDQKVYKGEE